MINKFRKIGREITKGVLDVLAVLFIIGFCLSWLINATIRPIDDCDAGKLDRCGFNVLTDNKTGQEYLVTPQGGVIERK